MFVIKSLGTLESLPFNTTLINCIITLCSVIFDFDWSIAAKLHNRLLILYMAVLVLCFGYHFVISFFFCIIK